MARLTRSFPVDLLVDLLVGFPVSSPLEDHTLSRDAPNERRDSGRERVTLYGSSGSETLVEVVQNTVDRVPWRLL